MSRFLLVLAVTLLTSGALSGSAVAQQPADSPQPPADDAPPGQTLPAGDQPPAPAPSEESEGQAPAPGTAKPAAPEPAAPAGQTPKPAPAPAAPSGRAAPILPPEGSPPLVRYLQLTFPKQGDVPVVEPQTYLYYIEAAQKVSRPSDGIWVPYDESIEKTLLADFDRLWATGFLDDLAIEVVDDPWPNGVIGKRIIFKMEERERIKIVDYTGTKAIDQSAIDEVLKKEGIQIRLDSFVDPSQIRRVEGIIRELMGQKGYQYAKVTHEMTALAGGPKLVHLSFKIDEGPKVKIKRITFEGNKAMSDGELRGKMKVNKSEWFLSWITGRGTYQEAGFAEDADRIIEHYRNEGYIAARVGQPEIVEIGDSDDGKTRYIELKIPITEGDRYRVGSFDFEGNKVLRSEGLRELFRLKEGDWYSEKKIRKGMEQARELYGRVGYWEFTGYPDLNPRNLPDPNEMNDPQAVEEARKQPAIVDVTMRLQEGEQYFVNRITFKGNTTTRDNVIRREMRLLEGGVFDTEALKYSVRRINQLGYFKELDGEENTEAVQVEKTPGEKNKVDITLNFEEQNRNQLTFGAGVSQFEGFFGQLAFQTSNFLGRGESVTFAVLAGRRVQNYQLAFSEPFLFDRPITAGLDLYKRDIQYYFSYTQASVGGNMVIGFPVADFTRMFLTYSLEETRVKDINELFLSPEVINRNPFLKDALLVGEGGRRMISKISPTLVHNTIDNPIFPAAGKRLTLGFDFAGIGGDVNFVKPRVEAVWWVPQGRRFTLGMRAAAEYIRPFASTVQLPIYERLFLGGEYSVRGYDIRTIGPRDIGTPQQPGTFLVLGGNKSLLFNAEYHFAIAGPVRVIGYFDAGQVQDDGLRFRMDEFIMSTGAEVRFFMPVLNVPFRLIYARNLNNEGIFDNRLLPSKDNVFKFAVGSTF